MSRGPSTTRQDSRRRVLAVLRASGSPLGVGAVAAQTGLSPNAVRFHLGHLLDEGSVRPVKDPGHAGPGRPAVLYAALPAEAVDGAAAYRRLAGLLASELSRSADPGAPVDAGRAWARSLTASNPAPPADRDPVELVSALFELTGFAPRVGADGASVELHRCPFLLVAQDEPAVVCGLHLGLVTGLLDEVGLTQQARLSPVLDGSGPCVVHIHTDGPPGGGSVTTTTRQEPLS